MLRSCFISFLLATTLLSYSQGDSANAERASRKVVIPKNERSKGYVGWIEGGAIFLPLKRDYRPDPYPAPSLRIFNGARLGRHVALGIETGLDASVQVLLNAKVRVNVLKRKVTPFFDFSAGYSFIFLVDNNHGFNFNPSAGFKVWGKKGKAAFTFRAGYYGIYTSRQLYHSVYDNPPPWFFYHGIQLAIGIEF